MASKLKSDLLATLSDLDFEPGHLAFARTLEHAPNPWLAIEGLGVIGLPLTERDAKFIATASGRGQSPNAWIIPPSRISFKNPEWQKFLNRCVSEVLEGLGITTRRYLDKTHELVMLLLRGPGPITSSNLSVNRSRTTFANFEIHLPSVYSGGQVHASYCGDTKGFDLSSQSLHTNLFASYTEVIFSTEISSGYRLSLCYNLIHTGSTDTIPTILPINEPLSKVRSVLVNWKNGQYTEDIDSVALVHFITSYEEEQLKELKRLDWDDQVLITNLRRVAEDLGYRLFLGVFEYAEYGRAERGIYKCSDDGECPNLAYVEGTNKSIGNLVDPEGQPVLDRGWLDVRKHCSLEELRDYFEDEEPDSRSCDDSICSYAVEVVESYTRAVLVLVHLEDQPMLSVTSKELDNILTKLKGANPTNILPDAQELAELAISKLGGPYPYEQRIKEMLAIAIAWKDINLWKGCYACTKGLKASSIEPNLLEGLHIFGFLNIRPLLDQISAGAEYGLQVPTVRSILDNAQMKARVVRTIPIQILFRQNRELQKVFPDGHLRQECIPQLIEVARNNGIAPVMDIAISVISRQEPTMRLLLVLMRSLRDVQASEFVPELSSSTYERYMKTLLEIGMNSFAILSSKPIAAGRLTPEIVADLVTMCSLISPSLSHTILSALFKLDLDTDPRTLFDVLLIPFVPLLRTELWKCGCFITSPPFAQFARRAISLYLRDVLGVHRGNWSFSMTLDLHYRCHHCFNLCWSLAHQPEKPCDFSVQDLTMVKHIKRQIKENASNILTCSLYQLNDLFVMRVQKRLGDPTIKRDWEERRRNARAFLRSFGGDYFLQILMGDRFMDVQRALDGTVPFHTLEGYIIGAIDIEDGGAHAAA
ncbi:hypothetical protein BDN72DRAFT_966360 [Pluteus cervinus]|uniref:Uncharacterized protein n=1 Tax=Pluteus cervinus TaxID=181527 RepID=A0ACD2ZZ74_9AGAR|nr:hypothetical protein BDN72DRAFT_966360 [Pluteus cervinus]